MRKIVSVMVVGCWLLIAGCSDGQDRTAVFGDDDTFLLWALGTDGTSVWTIVDRSSNFDRPAEVVGIDAVTGDVEWRRESGVGSSSDPVLYGSIILANFKEPLLPETIEDGELAVQIDIDTGDIIDQKELPKVSGNPVVVDDVLWQLGRDRENIYIRDAATFELVETIDISSMQKPDGRYVGRVSDMLVLGDTMWFLNSDDLVALDMTTHQIVEVVDSGSLRLSILEVHHGLLWASSLSRPDEATFSYDPESGEVISATLYESPIGNKYHDGYTYDMIDSSTMAQVDTESGEQVATFTDLDPFSVVVTDGFLWAKDDSPWDQAGTQIFRYETKP